MLRQVYHLPLRQTEGFVRSLLRLMQVDLNTPDYSCLSRRSISLELKRLIDSIEPGSHIIIDSTGLKVYGKDEWHQEKHNVKARRTFRRLHLGIDENLQIVACDLTDTSVGDTTAVPELLEQAGHFDVFMGDGAYDSTGIYDALMCKNPNAQIVAPPPKNAVAGASPHEQRNAHVDYIEEHGRMAWQEKMNYGLRALVELTMLRYKTIIGPKMKARKIPQQKTEAQVSVRLLNMMTSLGMPESVKIS